MRSNREIILKIAFVNIFSVAFIILFFFKYDCLAFDGRDLFSQDIFKSAKDLIAEKKNIISQAPAPVNKGNSIRIATYNLEGVSNYFKTASLAGVVKNINADLVFLTEAVAGYIIYPNQPKVIADAGKYPYNIFKGNISIWTYFEKMGNAVLSRTPMYGTVLKDLPKIRKDSELRGIAAAKTKVNGREIVLICAHLSRGMHRDERVKQVEFLAEFIKSNYAGIPVILAGDFNTTPAESDVLKPVTDIMDDGFLYLSGVNKLSAAVGATIPSDKPTVKFDYIFLSKDKFNIKSFQVYPSMASDHRPFVVDVELK